MHRNSEMVGVAQLVRVSDCGPEGRGFDPLHPPRKRDCSKEQSLFFYKNHTEYHVVIAYRLDSPYRKCHIFRTGGDIFLVLLRFVEIKSSKGYSFY